MKAVNYDEDEDDEDEDDEDEDDDDEDEDDDDDEDDEKEDDDEDDEKEDDADTVKHIDGFEKDLDVEVSMLLGKTETSRIVDLSDVVSKNDNTSNETDTAANIDLNKMTIQELREHAVLIGLAIDPKIKKKAEIIELMQNV